MAGNQPERILVIQMKRIGDLILTIPAIQVLRRAKPEAQITVATLGAAGQIVPAIPGVDEHLDYRKGQLNLTLWAALIAGGWDIVLDYNGSDRTCLMTSLAQANQRATYTKRAQGWLRELVYTHLCDASLKDYHTIDHLIALGEAVGIPLDREGTPESVRLDLSEQHLSAAGQIEFERYAVVHPGTARAEKYWPADRWAKVIDFLYCERDLPVVITGGNDAAERRHIEGILSDLDRLDSTAPEPRVLAGDLTLLETAGVISRCEIALGVDTAAMHLAAAFEKRQIVLFGPTDPQFWGPRHQNATVICPSGEFTRVEDRRMEDISVEVVTRELH